MTEFKAHKNIDEAKRRAALKKMKTLATLLLLGMAILFLVSYRLEKIYPLLGALRAFSEAAMVGALADWFAVVALFKHPLSLPIPHTAIIQRHKDRFGQNLATFIKNNFLARETLEQKLRSLDVTAWIGEGMMDQKRMPAITAELIEYLVNFLNKFDDGEFKNFSTDLGFNNLQKINVSSLCGDILAMMMKGDRHQALLDEALVMMSHFLEANKATFRKTRDNKNTRWIPAFIDDIISDTMLDKMTKMLADIHRDRGHELRKRFNAVTRDFISNLQHSDDFIEKVNALGTEFLADPLVMRYFEDFWSGIKVKLMQDLQDPGSELRIHIEKGILVVGQRLVEDPSAGEGLNRWIHTALVDFAEEYVDKIISIISGTVQQWDALQTSQTIELYVGKDLQWIRINGTIVGGLVGLLIYIFTVSFQ